MSADNETNALNDTIESELNDNTQNSIDSTGHEEMVSPDKSNHSNSSASYSESDSDDDDYFLSDEEELTNINSNPDEGVLV